MISVRLWTFRDVSGIEGTVTVRRLHVICPQHLVYGHSRDSPCPPDNFGMSSRLSENHQMVEVIGEKDDLVIRGLQKVQVPTLAFQMDRYLSEVVVSRATRSGPFV